jgi:hypothetical protein
MHNLNHGLYNDKFEIEETRRKVASLIAQSMTEMEIAEAVVKMLNLFLFPGQLGLHYR